MGGAITSCLLYTTSQCFQILLSLNFGTVANKNDHSYSWVVYIPLIVIIQSRYSMFLLLLLFFQSHETLPPALTIAPTHT